MEVENNTPGKPARPPGRLRAAAFSVTLLAAVLAPVAENFRDEPEDSFPLSYYPMFSARRSPTPEVTYLVGLSAAGERYPIHYRYAGVGGMNQVRRQIRRRVREGAAGVLCADVASKVARARKPPLADVVTVQIITGEFRLDDYFRGDKRPLQEEVRASCAVQRRPES
jgi:hypothetical protein